MLAARLDKNAISMPYNVPPLVVNPDIKPDNKGPATGIQPRTSIKRNPDANPDKILGFLIFIFCFIFSFSLNKFKNIKLNNFILIN